MSDVIAPLYRSAFVPHDLAAPIAGAAGGPLAGLTAAVKDMYDIAGYRVGSGNPTFLETCPIAAKNAGAIQRILDAGATIIGKTVCDEFFFSVTGANAHYGTPANPRAPGRLPGGSSSGSASAVASGACDFALGSDTGGSVRIPASFNGLYGLRPTLDRIDLSGVQAMAPSFDVPGWFAASPGIFRKVGAVLLDQRRVAARLDRMIVLEDAFAEADDDVADLLRSALEFMTDDLPPVAHARISLEGFDPWREAFRTIQGYEVWQTFGAFVARYRPQIGPGVRERIEFSARVSEAEAQAARRVQAQARDHILQTVQPGTILALPTAPCIAPPIDGTAEEMDHFRTRVMRLTCTAGMAGLPQLNLPIGTLNGCPVGLSFIGWPGGDEVLLDLACELSRHCGMAA
ncbi:MAG TPA: amidase [Pseudolabrys sp.]|nr:amidase [Pseudolabrys sp.]